MLLLLVFSRLSSYHLSSIIKKREYRLWVRHIIGGGGNLLLTLARERGKFTYSQLHKKWMPRSTPTDWTGAMIRFSRHAKMTNEIQICFSKWWENEKRNSNPFFKVMRKRKRKLKLMSVFQSDAKTKNKIRSSKPFFKVRWKRKTKSKIQICFSIPCENEKWIWHLNSFSHAIEKRLALRYTH